MPALQAYICRPSLGKELLHVAHRLRPALDVYAQHHEVLFRRQVRQARKQCLHAQRCHADVRAKSEVHQNAVTSHRLVPIGQGGACGRPGAPPFRPSARLVDTDKHALRRSAPSQNALARARDIDHGIVAGRLAEVSDRRDDEGGEGRQVPTHAAAQLRDRDPVVAPVPQGEGYPWVHCAHPPPQRRGETAHHVINGTRAAGEHGLVHTVLGPRAQGTGLETHVPETCLRCRM
mmetsp:Transcript_79455/g.243086  ORF Transcript_79455/g.243086 Transcript_79455/m.243086 type:complete len:233 (+) Transcript_79455:35-733(+)